MPSSTRATLALLDVLAPDLPDHFVITGPTGLAERLAPGFTPDWVIPHVKMRPPRRRPSSPGRPPCALARPDGDRRRRRPAGDRWRRQRLLRPRPPRHGPLRGHPGRRRVLAAVAGVHVLSEAHGVAAIGNVLTHPAHRRQGLARALMATLARRLLDRRPGRRPQRGDGQRRRPGSVREPRLRARDPDLRRSRAAAVSLRFRLHPGGEHREEDDPYPGRTPAGPRPGRRRLRQRRQRRRQQRYHRGRQRHDCGGRACDRCR